MINPSSPSSAVTPATAAPAPTPKPPRAIKDVTPPQGMVHEVVIPAEAALDFLNILDPQAPTGKLARSISVQVAPKGELQFKINYAA